MGVDDDSSFLYEQRSGNFLDCQSSQIDSALRSEKVVGTRTSSMSVCKEVSPSTATSCSASVAEKFLVTDWNPITPAAQIMDCNGSTVLPSYNVGVPGAQGINCSNAAMIEQIPRLSCFSSGSFSEIMSSIALSESIQIATALCPADIPSNNEHVIETNLKGKKRKIMSDCGALHPHSPLDRIRVDQPKDVSPETTKSPTGKDEKKQKSEVSPGVESGDAPKEDYIHVRAKRGQATNSHSLAERVRREKISERMRYLQDLVPGCNKITGKAVMLDEIINYVQSLQRQVEFLSMKLAAVNPELNFDIEQILSKDILHSRDGSSAVLGFGPGMSIRHPRLIGSSTQEVMQPEMVMYSMHNPGDMLRTQVPQISTMAQMSSVWDDELQNVVHMGFIPNLPFDGSELNSSMKVEL